MTAIRRAVPSDLAELLQLCAAYCTADSHDFEPGRARAGFEPLLKNDDLGVVWLAETDERSVGYAVVTWGWSIESGGRDALLDEVYAGSPGAGVGSMLMERLLDDCRRRGLPRVFLETERHNESARRFYHRFGFVVEDSVWMALDLGSGDGHV